jgi:acetolactate synthase-1/2/3 large subunit
MTDLVSVVVRELARSGVRQAFGVVGAGNFLAVAGLIRHGVDYVAARHEGGAMAMADAYYRATGETAVCATTHGAGLSNTATALSEAVKHRSSVIVICGDAPTGGPRPFDMNTAGFAEGTAR